MIDKIPIVLKNIIIDYKNQLEVSEKKQKLLNEFKNSYKYKLNSHHISHIHFNNYEHLYCFGK